MKHNTSQVTVTMREVFKLPVTVDYVEPITIKHQSLITSGSVSSNE